jgi:uncharacterized protein
MNNSIRERLIAIATEKLSGNDPSHDFEHALRVLHNAEHISEYEKADSDVIVPAALFHDAVIYPKDDPRSKSAPDESAILSKAILGSISDYPKEKISLVEEAIRQCSFSKNISPSTIEAKVLQDADRLEATGAISIMRTFASTGQMGRPFYHPDDPFCDRREPQPLSYALDLFYERLLVVGKKMHTEAAKKIAQERTDFLQKFLEQLRKEIQ